MLVLQSIPICLWKHKLKSVYLAKKQNCRLDKLLDILLKIARDIIFDRLRKHEIGERTHKV